MTAFLISLADRWMDFVFPMSMIGATSVLIWYVGGRYEPARKPLRIVYRQSSFPDRGMDFEDVADPNELSVGTERAEKELARSTRSARGATSHRRDISEFFHQ